jgi:hypothetical protein
MARQTSLLRLSSTCVLINTVNLGNLFIDHYLLWIFWMNIMQVDARQRCVLEQMKAMLKTMSSILTLVLCMYPAAGWKQVYFVSQRKR